MKRDINRLAEGQYDCLIVGGGINGAAIANIAALNGLKVALLEKNDFASGTSSKSTKLVHGGIRYLENFDFELVREALRERSIQLKSAPHLVQPIPFIIPVYKNDKRPLWMMKVGVFLYDFLSGKHSIGQHQHLTAEQVLQLEPNICSRNLVGGVMYYDAQMNDARLVLENILMADKNGAHVANYVEVTELLKENGKIVGVKARDVLTGQEFRVRATKTICTVGPWTNEFLKLDHHQTKKKIRTTKGIHIVYKGQLTSHALLITSRQDNRIFFVIPWMGNSLIGTTDTNYTKSPDCVEATSEDIEYLLQEARRVFPKIEFKLRNIITTFAGLRPLIRKGGSPSKVSRKHLVYETHSGLVCVLGGKYTTYRKIAEDAVNFLMRDRLVDTRSLLPLYGGQKIDDNPQVIAASYNVSVEIVKTLMSVYGSCYKDVLGLVDRDARLKETVCEKPAVIKAQIVYAIEMEMAQKPEDIIERRLPINYMNSHPNDCSKTISEIFKKYQNQP